MYNSYKQSPNENIMLTNEENKKLIKEMEEINKKLIKEIEEANIKLLEQSKVLEELNKLLEQSRNIMNSSKTNIL